MIKQLQEEVTTFYSRLEKQIADKWNYLGYSMFMSPVSTDVDILFIGINPGNGAEDQTTSVLDRFQYLKEKEDNFPLARDTKKFFAFAGYPNLLMELDARQKIAKTNFFYCMTRGFKELLQFQYNVLNDEQRHMLFQYSKEWTKRLVEFTNPKLIICEGKQALVGLSSCFPECENTFPSENAVNQKVIFKNQRFVVLKYNRSPWGMRDMQGFAELLKKELDVLYK